MPLIGSFGNSPSQGFGQRAGVPFLATGGTITTFTSGGITYISHVFTSNGTFSVSSGLAKTVDYLIAAGGGGGGSEWGGGGGGGGLKTGTFTALKGSSVSITIGAGGNVATNANGNAGVGSSTSGSLTVSTTGGGRGGTRGAVGGGGGSGGGGGGSGAAGGGGTAGEGNAGATAFGIGIGGGGGGKGNAGSAYFGGSGFTSSLSGTSITYSWGGAAKYGTNSTAGTGQGGWGRDGGNLANAGASGVVVFRYRK